MTVRAPKCRDQVAVESAQPSSAAGSSDKARGRYHRFCAADPAAPAAFARMPRSRAVRAPRPWPSVPSLRISRWSPIGFMAWAPSATDASLAQVPIPLRHWPVRRPVDARQPGRPVAAHDDHARCDSAQAQIGAPARGSFSIGTVSE